MLWLVTVICQLLKVKSYPSHTLYIPITEVQCRDPNDLENIILNGKQDKYSYQSMLTITCDVGMRFLDGTEKKIVECNSEGKWNQSLSSCEGNITSHHLRIDNW